MDFLGLEVFAVSINVSLTSDLQDLNPAVNLEGVKERGKTMPVCTSQATKNFIKDERLDE